MDTNTLKFIATMTGRTMRADAKSYDNTLPKSQRDFHAGRREGYLQAIAVTLGLEVKDIRVSVLGSDSSKECEERNARVRVVNHSFPHGWFD